MMTVFAKIILTGGKPVFYNILKRVCYILYIFVYLKKIQFRIISVLISVIQYTVHVIYFKIICNITYRVYNIVKLII